MKAWDRLIVTAMGVAVLVGLVVAQVDQGPFVHLPGPVAQWATITFALILQALPLVTVGALLSAGVSAWLPPDFFTRFLPRNEALRVPVAAALGMFLPTCECASVPVTRSLMGRGLPAGAAFAFMMAAPAINPLVLVATFLAYQATPWVVAARFVAGFIAACIVGWGWSFTRQPLEGTETCSHAHGFRDSFVHDVLHTLGYLVIGCGIAAAVKVALPPQAAPWSHVLLAIATMMLLAVVMSICSEADAFIAASFTAAPMSAQLAFMVLGPMLDVKLVALQWGTFGRAATWRLALLAVVATLAAVGIASWLFS